MTLTEFLEERVGEDEAAVTSYDENPARALAECEAKRRLIDELTYVAEQRRVPVWGKPGVFSVVDVRAPYAPGFDQSADAETVLQILATVYADHPDYDEAWRP